MRVRYDTFSSAENQVEDTVEPQEMTALPHAPRDGRECVPFKAIPPPLSPAHLKRAEWTSLVAERIRICLPKQGT